jgi:trans-2,3-dihydro-3-hydroxyanthranilate isomerase
LNDGVGSLFLSGYKWDHGNRLMRRFRMKQVDVFTDRPLTGNPLAVFLDGVGLSSDEMLAIAREMNLSETTFVLPPTRREAHYKVRIFTPAKEIPFAGHPSIGTAHALIEDGGITLKQRITAVRQEVEIGVLPIEIESITKEKRLITMTQGKPKLGQVIQDTQSIADMLGIPNVKITSAKLPVQVSSTGLDQLMIPIRSLEQVQKLSPKFERLADLERRFGVVGCSVFTLETSVSDASAHVRFFAPAAGVFEDPATGSAAGALGAYLVSHGVFGSKNPVCFTIEQGSEIHRPSRITVTVEHEANVPTLVKVGGEAVTILDGELVL